MLARVLIRPKSGVVDPQGKAVERALPSLGFEGVEEVRIGRMVELHTDDPDALPDLCEKLLANPLIEDYEIEISFEGRREAAEVWEFTLVPRPDAPVVWGRIVEQVRKSDMMPTWVRYFDEDGSLVRTMTFDDFRVMGGGGVIVEINGLFHNLKPFLDYFMNILTIFLDMAKKIITNCEIYREKIDGGQQTIGQVLSIS